jgi:hypothetical protein
MWVLQRPATVFWVAVFLYAALTAVLVQTVVLPHWVPWWHAGHGLLAGLDSVAYHEEAVAAATGIRERGWTAWTLRPEGHLSSGVASALYALTVPEPWVFIPVSAALHASAAVTLLRILEIFAPVRVAVLGILPFVLFPSALTWYTQIQRDGFAVLGLLLVALGWARVARATREPTAGLGRGLLPLVAGEGVVWLARPYLVHVLLPVGVSLAVLVTGMVLAGALRRRRTARTTGRAVVRTWVAALAVWPFVSLSGQRLPEPPPPSLLAPLRGQRPLGPPPPPRGQAYAWTWSHWMPRVIDRRLGGFAKARQAFFQQYPQAGSNMDPDVTLTRAGEVLAYVPRALQVTLFAPFPSQWTGGVTPGATVMRRVAGAEMLVFYLAVAALPWGLWRWRDRVELHVLALYCLGMMLVYALAIPNVGALYRFRYPFATLLIGLGVVSVLVRREPAASPSGREGAVGVPRAASCKPGSG